MLSVKFYDSVSDDLLKFAVIAARCKDHWVFCKHHLRDTLEFPGGRREPGEEILATAHRELQEETGALDYSLTPLCVYSVTGPTRVNEAGDESFGLLCFAEIHTFDPELHSEMERIFLLKELPDAWTYPQIQPKLLEEVQRRLSL